MTIWTRYFVRRHVTCIFRKRHDDIRTRNSMIFRLFSARRVSTGRTKDKTNWQKRTSLLLRRLICWGAVGYCVTTYAVEPVLCVGWSMYPAVNDGDIFLAEHFSVRSQSLSIGDVVACRSPIDPRMLLCKRLLAVERELLPGFQTETNCDCDDAKPRRIPLGHVWLQGDNSDVSNDSRMFGPVPYGLIVCRLRWRIWPLTKMGPIQDAPINHHTIL